jgi:hypothetical protein
MVPLSPSTPRNHRLLTGSPDIEQRTKLESTKASRTSFCLFIGSQFLFSTETLE